MAEMVRLHQLKKNYGKKEALKGLNLEIDKGELFVLLGPNGAGKTTTIKMLVGLLQPTSGSIHIAGHDMIREPQKVKSAISYVPDTPYVYEKLTPRELLRFVGKLYHMHPKQIEERGAELLRFFSLDDVSDVLIEEFSHGMHQKAILAAALLHDPQFFVLDEPMVGLDPASIKSFKDFLRRKRGEGMTILFSTHTLAMAEELADRIAILNRGELVAIGSLEDLRRQYQSRENLESMFMKLVEKEEKSTS